MIKEFINGNYHYILGSPTVVISKVKINNVDISKYLTNESKIGWYDVTSDSNATNADGTMVFNVINTKYRLDLVTRPLLEYELIDFYKEILENPIVTIDFYNPFTGTWKQIECYRGDRSVQTMYPIETSTDRVELYSPISQSFIEL